MNLKRKEKDIIKINDSFRLKIDETNVVLQRFEEHTKKSGEKHSDWLDKGYYSSIGNALSSAVELDCRQAKDLESMAAILQYWKDKYRNMTKEGVQ